MHKRKQATDRIQILYNAKVYTLDPQDTRATALAIRNGIILSVGSDEEILGAFAGKAQATDLCGKTILPGLTDAHIHLEYYGRGLQKVDCETAAKAACLQRVAERVHSTPPGKWVLGHGWNQNVWGDGSFPSGAELDAISKTHPIYLTAKSLHAGWANSLALQEIGFSPANTDPEIVLRDASGNLTGIILEGALDVFAQRLPQPSLSEIMQALSDAQTQLWRMGITGVHNFDGGACFSALQELNSRSELRLRVLQGIPVEAMDHAIALGLRSGFGNDFLRIGSVKSFADGALGPQTAAMLEPFESASGRGMLLMDGEQFFEIARRGAEGGLSMAVHAIGDRATHEMLNGYEQLRKYEKDRGLPALRHRIEHLQLLHAQDAARPARLGITASMQPMHGPSDMDISDRYWGKRSALAYAWQTQLESGATLAFGSDAPVESPNPFWGLHAAVTRRRFDGSPNENGWYPEQRLSLSEALHAYTRGAAYAAGLEDRQGCLRPAYFADLLVMDGDPYRCEPAELYKLLPAAVMVDGDWVKPL